MDSEHKDYDFTPEFVSNLEQAVLRLPVKVSLPRFAAPLSLPRYYLLVLENKSDMIEFREIVGVRADLTPTKWSYKLGYWHPQCQLGIARALARLLKRQSQLQQPQ
jgi:hypothetical protein